MCFHCCWLHIRCEALLKSFPIRQYYWWIHQSCLYHLRTRRFLCLHIPLLIIFRIWSISSRAEHGLGFFFLNFTNGPITFASTVLDWCATVLDRCATLTASLKLFIPNQDWQIMDVQLIYWEVQVQEWQYGSMPCTPILEWNLFCLQLSIHLAYVSPSFNHLHDGKGG